MSERETVRPHIRQRDFVDRNISAIEDHVRKGKVLLPPFSKIAAPMAFHSWKDNCIPNILWACILAAHLEREHYLDLFRKVVVSTRENLRNYEETYITHNHLAVRPEAEFATILDPVLADPEATRLVSALLLLESLPDRHLWAKHVVVTNPEQGWTILAAAVALCLDHQSQRSTDVRWLKLIHIITIGKMIFDAKMKERTEELRLYPDKGDMRTVRPFIRASEMMLRPYEDGDAKPKHVPDSPHLVFWAECYAKTECIVDRKLDRPEDNIEPLVRELLAISDSITAHFASVSDDTGIDPRRDASFGVVLYAVALAMDAARGHSHQLPVGRIVLRSIVEVFITLRFLTFKDDPTIWAQYRTFGSGQAKLSFLKNVREECVPDFIDLKELESLANEDLWLEYQSISLGSWTNGDLRKMAAEAGCKDVYDKYYTWSSGFTHGHWAAIRESVFATCFNPLHRLHRVPAAPRIMPSVMRDCCVLINRMLDDLNHLYPTFKLRLRWHKNPAMEMPEREAPSLPGSE